MHWKEGFLLVAVTCLLMALVACGDDDGYAPPYEMGIMDIRTDGAGKAVTAIDDLDREWQIAYKGDALKADTVYRCMALFVQQESHLDIYRLGSVLTMTPFQWKEEFVFHGDPVKVQSRWKTNRYINFTLLVPRKELSHSFGFVDGGIRTMDSGYRKATVGLYHDANGDDEAFDATVYLSLPLAYYSDSLVSGRDSIYVSIPVKGKGWVSYPFPF